MHVRVLVSIFPSWTDIQQSLIHFINPIQFQFALSPPQTWARHPPHHRIVVVCHREAIVNVNWTVWLVWSVGWVGAQLVDMYESKGGESEFSSSYTILDLVCALVAISPQNTQHSAE